MKKWRENKFFLNFNLYFITLFSVEVIFRLITNLNIFTWDMIRIILGVFIISILFSAIFSNLTKKINLIINFIVLFLLTTYIIAQLGFINFVGVYMSFNATTQFGAVTDYITDFILSFKWNYFLVYLPLLIAGILIYYNYDNYEHKNKYRWLYSLKSFGSKLFLSSIIILISLFLYQKTLTVNFMQNKMQLINNKELFLTSSIPTISVKSFGVLGFGISDLRAKFYHVEENTTIIYSISPSIQKETVRKFDDTAWNNIINKEKNKTYNLINNYLINQESTSINGNTGIFKNKNLIIIMMESVNDIINNEKYFPNFNTLLKNGIYFSNNYSPRNSCPTGNNEFSGLTGIYTIYNNCTANVYKNNTYPYSLYNLFNESNYHTIGMHNYFDAYYSRHIIHPNLGADKFYGVKELNIRYSTIYREWASDEDFASSAMNIIQNNFLDEFPFMLWMTTVSPHQPYSVSSIEGDKYLNLFEEESYPMDLKRYLSKVKVTDDAIGVLLHRLEELNILDDTVIVLYGDHYPYGLSKKTLSEQLNRDLVEDYEVDKVPLLIYNKSIKSANNLNYTSYINILPTIANLFDLNYDPRLYFGKDLFSPEYESRVVFADGSWKNEFAYYKAITGDIQYYKDFKYNMDEIQNINNKITAEMKLSNLIIKNNYFEYLHNQLTNEKEFIKLNETEE